jgi:plasmid stabilization system protein ParE
LTTGYAFHPEAVRDLEELWEYIAADSPDAADRVLSELFAALEMLGGSPNVGHRRPDLSSHALRFWPVRSYLIAYAPDVRPLWVVAVLHGRRSPRLLAALLQGRG